jgi:hypothetical protein
MKGRIVIKLDHETGNLYFGNLKGEGSEIATMQGISSHAGLKRCAIMIAHDAVEHSKSHSVNTYVTYEAELKALGASQFINCRSDIIDDIKSLLGGCWRDIEPVPEHMVKYLKASSLYEPELLERLIEDSPEISEESLGNALLHCAWGYVLKSWQFGTQFEASNVFHYVVSLAEDMLEALRLEDGESASLSFDSEARTDKILVKSAWGY